MVELPDDITPEELEVFLEDTNEQIQRLDEGIVKLEDMCDDPDLVQDLYRAAHTIKGCSAMLGYPTMAELSTSMAAVIDMLRKGTLPVTAQLTDDLLAAMDHLRVLRDNLTAEHNADVDITEVVTTLQEIASASPQAETATQWMQQVSSEIATRLGDKGQT